MPRVRRTDFPKETDVVSRMNARTPLVGRRKHILSGSRTQDREAKPTISIDGVLFAPVYFDANVYRRPGFSEEVRGDADQPVSTATEASPRAKEEVQE